jgi:hypothetical protein
MFDLITSYINGILKSSCKVRLETYHGAPDIIRSVLEWNDWSILVFDGLLQPLSSLTYVKSVWSSWSSATVLRSAGKCPLHAQCRRIYQAINHRETGSKLLVAQLKES